MSSEAKALGAVWRRASLMDADLLALVEREAAAAKALVEHAMSYRRELEWHLTRLRMGADPSVVRANLRLFAAQVGAVRRLARTLSRWGA